jgi:hypothetical protein
MVQGDGNATVASKAARKRKDASSLMVCSHANKWRETPVGQVETSSSPNGLLAGTHLMGSARACVWSVGDFASFGANSLWVPDGCRCRWGWG